MWHVYCDSDVTNFPLTFPSFTSISLLPNKYLYLSLSLFLSSFFLVYNVDSVLCVRAERGKVFFSFFFVPTTRTCCWVKRKKKKSFFLLLLLLVLWNVVCTCKWSFSFFFFLFFPFNFFPDSSAWIYYKSLSLWLLSLITYNVEVILSH